MATTLEIIEEKIRTDAEQKLKAQIDAAFAGTISGVDKKTLIDLSKLNTVGKAYILNDIIEALRSQIFETLKTQAFQAELADFLARAEKVVIS